MLHPQTSDQCTTWRCRRGCHCSRGTALRIHSMCEAPRMQDQGGAWKLLGTGVALTSHGSSPA